MDILNKEGSIVDTATSGLISSGAQYEYSVWANLGEKLVFVPRDPRYI